MARREHGLLAKVTECTVRGFKSAGCAGWLRECLWNAQDWCPELPQESMRTLGHPRGLACGRSVGSEQRSRQKTFCLGSKRNEQWRRLNELQKKPWRCSCLCMCGRKILAGSKLGHTVRRHVDCLNVQLSDFFWISKDTAELSDIFGLLSRVAEKHRTTPKYAATGKLFGRRAWLACGQRAEEDWLPA